MPTDPLTVATLDHLLAQITLPRGWTLRRMEKGDGFLIQILFDAPDNDDPTKSERQHCRKWYISRFSTSTEVVRTVYKAGCVALEHEFDETFKFMGVAIYNPHRSVFEMALARNRQDIRS